MTSQQMEAAYAKYRYEALFGVWLVVTGATFLRIKRQPYSTRLKVEQYESIFKGTSLGAVLLGIGMTPGRTVKRVSDSVPLDGITPAQNVRNNQAAVNGCEVGSLQEPSRHTCPCAAVPTPSHVNPNSHFLFSHDTVLIVPSKMLFRLGSARVDINLWNPLYAIAPFVLLLVSIPLATFAIVTTFIAVVALSCRGLVVYINLGTALLIAWLTPSPSKSPVVHRQPLLQTPSLDKMPSQRHRNRRSSNISITSSQDTAVITSSLAPKSGSFTALSSNNDGARDYEGVGGWRDTGDDDEEALWMSINGRLELPAGPPLRRHQRSLTGGAIPISGRNTSPEAIRMSPVQSRARTPMKHTTDERHGNGDYFPLQPIPTIRSMTNASDPSKRHQRQMSGSASSVSSTASGIMMVVKEAGE